MLGMVDDVDIKNAFLNVLLKILIWLKQCVSMSNYTYEKLYLLKSVLFPVTISLLMLQKNSPLNRTLLQIFPQILGRNNKNCSTSY